MCRRSALLVLLFAFAAAGAQEAPAVKTRADHWRAVVNMRLLKTVTLALDESTLSDAMANLRQMGSVAIFIDPAIDADDDGDISVTFSDTTVGEALKRVLGPLGLEYVVSDEAVFVFRRNAYSSAANEGAKLTDAKIAQLNAAIGALASDDFTVREKASAELAGLGAAAVPYLSKAVRASTDSEARLRMQRLIERFGAKPLPHVAPEVAAKLDAIDALVPADFESSRVGDALAYIQDNVSKRTGQALPIDVDDALRDQPLTMPPAVLHAGNMLRWVAVFAGAQIVLENDRLKFKKRDDAPPKKE